MSFEEVSLLRARKSNAGPEGPHAAAPPAVARWEAETERTSDEHSRILDAALNSLQDFTYVFDHQGRFVYSNRPLLDLLGISLTEIIGKNFFDLQYPPELAGRLQNQIQMVFEAGEAVRDETPFTGAAGQPGFYEYIFNPVFDPDGSVAYVAGTTRDITLRKRAEVEREDLVRQLRSEQAKLHYLFNHAPAFVATLNGPSHVFELTNPAYLQLLGHRDFIGRAVREVVPEVEGQGFFELLDHVYSTGEPFTGRELKIGLQRVPGGPLEDRYLDFVYQPIYGPDGAVTGIFAHGIDITEQVRARQEAEGINRTKDEFLATLSHELRTPLTAIIGWTTILQGESVSPEESALGLATIARNARAQGRLIEDILDVSRMITGKMRLETQLVDFRNIVAEAVNTILPAAQSKSVQVDSELGADKCPVMGDSARLQQVVWNLLSNAVKFTPRGGWIEIALGRSGHHMELVISDSGQGIAPDVLPYVFDRFRQADSSSTRAHSGLGLGLAIVRHLVELHGGSVQAGSPGLGQGAVFTVKLPLTESRPAVPGEPPAERATVSDPTGKSPFAGLHILLVDDQEDTRLMLRVVLEKRGAKVTTAHSVAEALAGVQRLRPDLLLSDIGMPGEDGFSLIKKVRALPEEAGGTTPAVALTAFVRGEDRERVLNSGFQAHLPKPIDTAELAAVIDGLFPKPEDAA